MFRRRILLVGGVMVAGYGTSLIYRSLSPPFTRVFHTNSDPNYIPQTTEERREIFDQIAAKYDRAMKFPEWLWGIKAYRKMMIQQAKGKVLEVAVGTGANLPYYSSSNGRVISVDAIDTSQPMLDQAQLKYDAIKNAPTPPSAATPPSKSASNGSATSLPTSIATTLPPQPPVTFTLMSTETLTFPSGSFDTVIDAYGLTCYADPHAALSEMIRVTRHDGRGRILLLESGRSNQYEWLNYLLDYRAKKYARASGSDLNRNIEELVDSFQRSGDIRVINKRSFHFGTSYLYVLGVTNDKNQEDARQHATGPPGGKFVPAPRLVGIELNPGPDSTNHLQSTLSEDVNLTSDLSSYSSLLTRIVPGRLLKDMIQLIVSFLNDRDWISSMQLCHHWLACGASSPSRHLSYSLNDDGMVLHLPSRPLLHHFTSVRRAQFVDSASYSDRMHQRVSGLTPTRLVTLSLQLPYLTKIACTISKFDPTTNEADIKWPIKLHILDLNLNGLVATTLISSILNSCFSITYLYLDKISPDEDQATFQSLNRLIQLESLTIHIKSDPCDDPVDILAAMKLTHLPPRLKYFNLCDGDDQHLSLTTLSQMTRAVELEELDLSSRHLGVGELELIHRFAPNLKRFILYDWHPSNFISLHQFHSLQQIRLTTLSLKGDAYTTYETALLSGLVSSTQLTSIHFYYWLPGTPTFWSQLSHGLIHFSSFELTYDYSLLKFDFNLLRSCPSLTSCVFNLHDPKSRQAITDFFRSPKVMPHLKRISVGAGIYGRDHERFEWIVGETRKDNYRSKEIEPSATTTTGAAADAHPPHPPLVGIELNPGPFSTTAGSMVDTTNIATVDPLNTTSTGLSRVSGGTLFKDGLHSIYAYLTPKEFMSVIRTCHHWCMSAYSSPALHFNYLDLCPNSDVYGHDQISIHSPLNYHFTRLTDSDSRVVESFDFVELVPLLPHLIAIQITFGCNVSDPTTIDDGRVFNIWPTRLQSLTLHFPRHKPWYSPNLIESIWRIHSLTHLIITHTGINSVFSRRLFEEFDPAVTMQQLTRLTDFTLTSNERLTDAFKPDYRTHALALPPSVTSLEIDGEYFLSSTLKCPPLTYSHLHRLRFHGDRRVALQLDDLARLAQLMPYVELLAELCFTPISSDFHAITLFTRLTSLELLFDPPKARVTESMIRSIGQLQSLTHLTLLPADTFARPTDWELLSQLSPNIISLNLVCIDPYDQFPHIVQYLSTRLIRLTLTPTDLTPSFLDLLSRCSSLVELVIDVSECRWGEYTQTAAFKLAWDYFNDANHLPQLIYLRLSSEPWDLDWIYDQRTGRNFWTYRRPPSTPTITVAVPTPPAPPLVGVELNPGPDSINHTQSSLSESITLTSDLSSYSSQLTQIVPGRLLKDMIHLIVSFLNEHDWITSLQLCQHWLACGASSPNRRLCASYESTDRHDPIGRLLPPRYLSHHFTSLRGRSSFYLFSRAERFRRSGLTLRGLVSISQQLPYLTSVRAEMRQFDSTRDVIDVNWPGRLIELDLISFELDNPKLISSIWNCGMITKLSLKGFMYHQKDLAQFEGLNQLIHLESLSLRIECDIHSPDRLDLLAVMKLTHLPPRLTYFNLSDGHNVYLSLVTLSQMRPAMELEELDLSSRHIGVGELELIHQFAPNLKRFEVCEFDPSNYTAFKHFHSLQYLRISPSYDVTRTFESSLIDGLAGLTQLTSIHFNYWTPTKPDRWQQFSLRFIHLTALKFTINEFPSLDVLRTFHSLTSVEFNVTSSSKVCRLIRDLFEPAEVLPNLQRISIMRGDGGDQFEWVAGQTREDNYRSKAIRPLSTIVATTSPSDRESPLAELNVAYAPPPVDLTREGIESHPGPMVSLNHISSLFNDGLHIILSYLSTHDWVAALNTCHHWSTIGATAPSRNMVFTYEPDIGLVLPPARLAHHFTLTRYCILNSSELVALVSRLPHLMEIKVGLYPQTCVSDTSVTFPSQLRKLSMAMNDVDLPRLILSISSCSSTLTSLALTSVSSSFQFTHEFGEMVRSLTGLTQLTVTGCFVSILESDFILGCQLRSLPSGLTSLNLSGGSDKIIRSLHLLSPLPHLTEFDLSCPVMEVPDLLLRLHQFAPNLTKLAPAKVDSSDFSHHLKLFKQLQRYEVAEFAGKLEVSPHNQAFLSRTFAGCPSLTSINLGHWLPRTLSEWQEFASLTCHILELTIRVKYVSEPNDAANGDQFNLLLAGLTCLPQLRSIRVDGDRIDEHIDQLKVLFSDLLHFPHVTYVMIGPTWIGKRKIMFEYDLVRGINTQFRETKDTLTHKRRPSNSDLTNQQDGLQQNDALQPNPKLIVIDSDSEAGPAPKLVGIETNPGPLESNFTDSATTATASHSAADLTQLVGIELNPNPFTHFSGPSSTPTTYINSRVPTAHTLFVDGLLAIFSWLPLLDAFNAFQSCHYWHSCGLKEKCRQVELSPSDLLMWALDPPGVVYTNDLPGLLRSPFNFHVTTIHNLSIQQLFANQPFELPHLKKLACVFPQQPNSSYHRPTMNSSVIPNSVTDIEIIVNYGDGDTFDLCQSFIDALPQSASQLERISFHSRAYHTFDLSPFISIPSLHHLALLLNAGFIHEYQQVCAELPLISFSCDCAMGEPDWKVFHPQSKFMMNIQETDWTGWALLESDWDHFISHPPPQLRRLTLALQDRPLTFHDLHQLQLESLVFRTCFTSGLPLADGQYSSLVPVLQQCQSLTELSLLTLMRGTFFMEGELVLILGELPNLIQANLAGEICLTSGRVYKLLPPTTILDHLIVDSFPDFLHQLSQAKRLVNLNIRALTIRWEHTIPTDMTHDPKRSLCHHHLQLLNQPFQLEVKRLNRQPFNFIYHQTAHSIVPAPPLVGVELNPGPDSITHAPSNLSTNINFTGDLSSYSPQLTQFVPGRLLKDMIHLIDSYLDDRDWVSSLQLCHHWQSCGASSPSRHLSYLVPKFDVVPPTFPPYRLLHHFTSIKFEGRVVRVSGVGVTPSQLFTLSTQLPYLTRISCTLLEVKSENEPIHSGRLIMIWPIRLNTLELNFNGWVSTKLISSIFNCSTITHLVLVNISPEEDMTIFEAVNQLIDLESLSLSIDPTIFAMMSDREYIDLLRGMRLTHLPLHLKYFSLCAGDGDFLFLSTLVQMTPAVELEEIALLGRVVDSNELELLHSFAPNLKRFDLSACDPSNFISLKLFHSLQHLHLHPPRFMLRNFPTYESSLVQGLIAAPQLSSIHWDNWIPVESDSWSQLSHGLIHLSSIEFTGINHHDHLSLNVLRPFPSLTSCVFNAYDFFYQPIIDFFRSPDVMPQLQHIYVSRKYPAAPFEWWTDQTRKDNYRSKAVGQTTTVAAAAPPTDRESPPVKLNAAYAPPLKDLTREGVEQNPGPVHSWRDIAASRVVDINPDSGPLTAATPLRVGVASNLDLSSAAASSTPSITGPSLTHPLTTPHPITTSSTASSSSLDGTSLNTSQTLFKDGLHSIFTFLSLRDLIHSVRTCRSWQAGSMRIPYHYLEIPVANQQPQVPPYYRANYHLVRVKNVTLSPKQVMNICQQLPTIIHFSFQLDVNTKDHVVSDLGKTEVIEWPSTLKYLTVDLNQYDMVDNSLPRFYSVIFSARSVVKLKLLGLGQFLVQRSFSLLPQLSQLTSFTTVGSTDATSQPQRILHCFTSHQLREMKELDIFHGAYLDLTIFTKKAAPNLKEINFLRYPFATYPSHLDLCAQTLPHLRVLRAGLPLDRLAKIGQLFPQLHTLGIYGHSRNWTINGHLIRASLISAPQIDCS